MVYPEAGRIQRRRIHIASVELRQPRSGGSAVGNGKRIQKWLHGGWGLLPGGGIGDHALLREWLTQPQAFIGKEEEGLVFHDGPAENPSKIILLFVRLCQMVQLREPIIRIESAIPEIFEQRAMESVGAGTGSNGDLAARSAPELRGE